MATARCDCLSTDKDRLLIVLILAVLYPVAAASIFVLYMFWLLPAFLSTAGTTPVILNPGHWLHGYWIVCVLVWLLLLAIFLPLMKDEPPKTKATSYKRESGVSMREASEMTPLKKRNNGVTVTSLSKAISDVSIEKNSDKNSSKNELMNSRDEIIVDNEVSKLRDNNSDDESARNSTMSLGERLKLTQSGEFLNDCLQQSYQSQNDLPENKLILGNTNCQVHSHDCDDPCDASLLPPPMDDDDDPGNDHTCRASLLPPPLDEDSDYAEPCDASNLPPPMDDSDNDSYKEPLHQKMDRASLRRKRHYAEIAKTAVLARQEMTPLSTGTESETSAINEDTNEATTKADNIDQQQPAPPILRHKKRGCPGTIDTSRASQVNCSAPSTMSPRESNMVFLYVNPDKDVNA